MSVMVIVKKFDKKYDVIIIGSGAGGATLAKELAMRGKDVLVVEKGKLYSSFGSIEDIYQFYEASKSTIGLRYSEEGVMLLRTFMAGGSTNVSCGNGIRCLETELADLDVFLEEEFAEAELELNIAPISEDFLSEGSKAIKSASDELGYTMELMPKFIDQTLCANCGSCFAGCQNSAKWTAVNYLDQARQWGADIIYGTPVHKIIIQHGKVRGIITGTTRKFNKFFADKVIVAAGALSTPLILEHSGIQHAGTGLFVDTFVNVYGVTNGLNQKDELPMALIDSEFYQDEGFIVSTFINPMKISRFAELGSKALTIPLENLIGLMVKIKDERTGCVHSDGTISKPVTQKDRTRLERGVTIAKEILLKAGADEKSFMISIPQGAHPGGTAAIGEIVNNNLETEVENLFVCDGSVLPVAPGLPPILTIVALAKRLAKALT